MLFLQIFKTSELPTPGFLITQCTLRIHQRWERFLRATGDFTDVTRAKKDGQFPAAHSVILIVVKPTFKKFLKENGHPHPLIYSGNFWPLTPICAYTCRTCSSLTLPSIICLTPTWPDWGQPGCYPPPTCARCEDTFKDQDLIVVHMIYHMLLKSYCEHRNAIHKVSMHYAELGAFIL